MSPQKQTWTPKVQLWKGNIMLTAQLSPEDAEQLISEGKAKRINSQAIIFLEANR